MKSRLAQEFLTAAHIANDLLNNPAVASSWEQPSALPGFTVGGLAEHLASQVINTQAVVAADPVDEPAVTLAEHYARSEWVSGGREASSNVAIRERGEQLAEEGPADLLVRLAQALLDLDQRLPGESGERVVLLPHGRWSILLDDYFRTRIMELVVHCDDLAYSISVATPEFPETVTEPVLSLLVMLAARRHGLPSVIRALTRAERAPASVSAF